MISKSSFTVGQIVAQLGVPLHRILYVIESRNIHPTHRMGPWRLYGPDELSRIKNGLDEIDARRAEVVNG